MCSFTNQTTDSYSKVRKEIQKKTSKRKQYCFKDYLLVAPTLVVVSLLPLVCTFFTIVGPADRCVFDIKFDALSAGLAEMATKLIKELLSLQRKPYYAVSYVIAIQCIYRIYNIYCCQLKFVNCTNGATENERFGG